MHFLHQFHLLQDINDEMLPKWTTIRLKLLGLVSHLCSQSYARVANASQAFVCRSSLNKPDLWGALSHRGMINLHKSSLLGICLWDISSSGSSINRSKFKTWRLRMWSQLYQFKQVNRVKGKLGSRFEHIQIRTECTVLQRFTKYD